MPRLLQVLFQGPGAVAEFTPQPEYTISTVTKTLQQSKYLPKSEQTVLTVFPGAHVM